MSERLLLNLFDYEAAALERLPPAARDYYAGGANDEVTLRENRAAWDRISVHYRVLRDVCVRDLATDVLGARVSMPVLVGPTAFQQMAHPDGEIATARAASEAGTLMVLSTLSTCAMEDVGREMRSPWWFQLYMHRDRGLTRDLIQRAAASGARAIVLTVDAPVGGLRERDVRNRFALPEGLVMRNMVAAGAQAARLDESVGGFSGYVNTVLDPSISWKDLDWLIGESKLPVLIKGVVRADDAVRACEHGAAGVVVSNHGGRQLDTSPATVEVLGPIVAAVKGRLPVFVDGGVRRGTDVLKAIALGARAVFIGRPVIWGLAIDGEKGVSGVLAILRHELDVAMALAGCCTVAEIDASLVSA